MDRKVAADMDRRAYLKLVGAGGAAGMMGLAGCTGGGGDGTTTTTEDGGNGTTTTGDGNGDVTTITPGTAPGFAPFEFKQGDELVGFDIDLTAAVVENMDGYELGEWQEFEFASLIPALTSENIDLIAAAMTINDERKQTIAFSDPYYEADQSVLVAAGGDFSPSSLDDLNGHPVGAQKGTTGESIVQEQVPDATYRGYDNYVLAVRDLENGNVDAVVLDKPVAENFASNSNVEVAFVEETGEQYGLGVRQDSDFLDALNQALATVQDDGTYDELVNKWFGQE
ncbi:basic amino acid ABC transporter substrate-binding protein [Haladaptatus sp. DYSN1]|uniref:basic amino acid ABC transporter substrate-binding protein n=1 Tax=unclassified Haladaptatus TaxID=2622732 RepID=UPI002405B81D|nr:basic amino acid ABC transporter substrate-binding protein [Haladaptatus sp. DYSN1]